MIDTRVKPQNVILYIRQSDARDDEKKGGIAYHEEILRAEAGYRGWGVLKVVIENDVPDGKGGTRRKKSASAFVRKEVVQPDGTTVMRVPRLRFHEVLKDLWSGRADGMLAVELDRSMRDPRDLEDLMDVVQARKLNVGSIGGTLEFTDGGTDDQIDRARFLVMMAHRESRAKQGRTRRARERDAHKAKGHGGLRPFGWADDWKTAIWEEREIVGVCSRRVLQGISLAALARELREAGVLTVSGKPWAAKTLKDTLVRPRNAGLVVYQDEILEDRTGEWDRLIQPELFYAVHDMLTDPGRTTNRGRATPRWQGCGVYECGICNDGTSVEVHGGKNRSPRYQCKRSTHIIRNAARVNRIVDEWVIDRLSKSDAIEIFTPASATPDIDAVALRTERAALQENLKRMAVQRLTGEIEEFEHQAARAYAARRLPEITRILSDAVSGGSPVADIINSGDVRATWENCPLATKQLVMRAIMTVKIMPSRHEGIFDDGDIVIRERIWTEGQIAA